jgi:hypothetical protein
MSKPVRSEEHKAFIRSLPCYVCALSGRLNSRHIEACHTPGSRGMGQKRSDLDTIPMCRTHHDYQHQIGWPAFIRKYQIDIPELLKALTEKPRLRLKRDTDCFLIRRVDWWNLKLWVSEMYGDTWLVGPTSMTAREIQDRLYRLKREGLIDTLFRPLVERQRHAG